MLYMNFLSMDYFIMVAKERSFTKAAKRLGITQQTLSAHIANLEREIGCELFVRHVPLELTYAGETFLRYATDFQHAHTMMMQEFDDIAHEETGVLRIAIAHTRERTIMPRIIAAYQRRRPGIMVDLIEGANEQHARRLADCEADIAIAHFEGTPIGVELLDFYNEEMILIISNQLWMSAVAGADGLIGSEDAQKRIARGDFLPLKDCPFILGQPDDIDGHIAAELFRRSGFRPRVVARSGNLQTSLVLTQLGVGASLTIRQFLDEMLDDEARKSLRVLPIGENARYAISFGIRRQQYRWSAITDFIQVAREALAV